MREERIGACRLVLGDMLEVLPTLGTFDACVTDPPFGISDTPLKGSSGTVRRFGKRGGTTNDWHSESDWDKALNPEWGLVCDAAPIVAWFGQWRKRGDVQEFMRWPLRAEIVWAKDCHTGPPSPVAPRDERIWVFAESGIKGATFETSVWDFPIIPTWSHKHHKNEKPVGLMRRLIAWLGCKTLVDPFAGSGSTIVAAAKMGLAATGIEKNEDHFNIAVERVRKAYDQPDLFVERTPAPVQESLL